MTRPRQVEGDVLTCLRLDIQPRRTRIWTRGLTVPNRVGAVSSGVRQTPASSSRIRNRPGWCPLV